MTDHSPSSPAETTVQVPVDVRVTYFAGLTHENLRTISATWPRTTSSPEPVATLLDRAVQQFAVGAVTYEDLTGAVETAIKSCEVALRERLGSAVPKRCGLFVLVKAATDAGMIPPERREWWDGFIRPLRNQFAHGDRVLFTPGMAAEALDSLFATIAALYPDTAPPS